MQNDQSKNGQPVSVGSTGGSAVCSFCGEQPHEIRECPACWNAEVTRAALLLQRKINRHACEEWAEDHTHLQNLCRSAGCTEHEVEGDSYGVPGIIQLADLLRDKLSLPNVPDQPRGKPAPQAEATPARVGL